MLSKSKKMKIGNEEYNFKMTNLTILKIDEAFGNYGTVLQGLMEGERFYTNSLKIMACSCLEKEWELKELVEQLSNEQMNNEIPIFATNLYLDFIGTKSEETEGKEEGKNQKAN